MLEPPLQLAKGEPGPLTLEVDSGADPQHAREGGGVQVAHEVLQRHRLHGPRGSLGAEQVTRQQPAGTPGRLTSREPEATPILDHAPKKPRPSALLGKAPPLLHLLPHCQTR